MLIHGVFVRFSLKFDNSEVLCFSKKREVRITTRISRNDVGVYCLLPVARDCCIKVLLAFTTKAQNRLSNSWRNPSPHWGTVHVWSRRTHLSTTRPLQTVVYADHNARSEGLLCKSLVSFGPSSHRTRMQVCTQICKQILWCCLQCCVKTPIGNSVFHFLQAAFASTSVPCVNGALWNENNGANKNAEWKLCARVLETPLRPNIKAAKKRVQSRSHLLRRKNTLNASRMVALISDLEFRRTIHVH